MSHPGKPGWSFSSSISLPLPQLVLIQRVVSKGHQLTLPCPFLEPKGTFEIHLPLTVRLQIKLYSLIITTFNSTSSLVPGPWENTFNETLHSRNSPRNLVPLSLPHKARNQEATQNTTRWEYVWKYEILFIPCHIFQMTI